MQTAMREKNPLQTTVISGYLGAGKTTFINALLQNARGLRITVLVNDFGAISLDESLIVNRQGDIIALANGCMCCQIGGDLYRTIDRILERRNLIDHLVIETSGVADPEKIANIARAETEMHLAHVMTVVDGLNFNQLLRDEQLADTLIRQLKAASLLLLTKREMADSGQIEFLHETLDSLQLSSTVHEDAASAIAAILKAVDDPARPSTDHPVSAPCRSLHLEPHPASHKVPFESWSWTGKQPLSLDNLLDLISDPLLGIYRCKGIVLLDDGTAATIHKVGDETGVQAFAGKVDEGTLSFIGPCGRFHADACRKAFDQMLAFDG